MNELQIFENEKFGTIRTLEEDGKVLFCAKDVAAALGYKDTTNAIKQHCKGVVKRHLPTAGGKQETNFIPEGDIYRLAAKSELPGAEEFESWIFDEVLPSIRKTGAYVVPEVSSRTFSDTDRKRILDIKEMNARVRMSNQFLKLTKVDTLSKEYKNILVAQASEVLTGGKLLPLPKSEQKAMSATEIGEQVGITAQMVGILSNRHHLKTPEYGEWYRSKSQYSNKEVDTFMYYETVIPALQKILADNQTA